MYAIISHVWLCRFTLVVPQATTMMTAVMLTVYGTVIFHSGAAIGRGALIHVGIQLLLHDCVRVGQSSRTCQASICASSLLIESIATLYC